MARFELGILEELVSVRLCGERRKMPGLAAVAPLLQLAEHLPLKAHTDGKELRLVEGDRGWERVLNSPRSDYRLQGTPGPGCLFSNTKIR